MGKLTRHSGQTREPPINVIDSSKQHIFADSKTVETRKPLYKTASNLKIEKSRNKKIKKEIK